MSLSSYVLHVHVHVHIFRNVREPEHVSLLDRVEAMICLPSD